MERRTVSSTVRFNMFHFSTSHLVSSRETLPLSPQILIRTVYGQFGIPLPLHSRLPHHHICTTENETIGAARGRRNKRLERRDQTDDKRTTSGAVEELGRGVHRPRNESRLSWQSSGGSLDRGSAAATATTSRGSPQAKVKNTTCAGSRGDKGAASVPRKPRGRRAQKKVAKNFGIPVGWSAEDFDYDDSGDETYAPPLSRNSCSTGRAGSPSTRCCLPRIFF